MSLAKSQQRALPAANAARDEAATWLRTRAAIAVLGLLLWTVILLAPARYAALVAVGLAAIALTLRYPVVGLGLIALAVPWASGITLPGGFSPTDGLIAALGVAWVVSAVAHRRSLVSTRIWVPYLFLFIAAILLSTTQAVDLRSSSREIIKWLELPVVFLAGVQFVRTRTDVRLIVAAVVTGGVTQALFGYLQTALQLGPAAFLHGAFLRAYGSFDQPNPYAGYLNMVLPLAVAMALLTPSRRERFWYGLSGLLLFGALVASESRGALLAGGFALVVVLSCVWSVGYRLAWLGAFAGVLAAWLATLGLISVAPFTRVLEVVGLGDVSFGHVTDANLSAVERAAHWLAGVRMFADHPLIGVGIGNYASAYPAYHPRSWYDPLAHAHNYYINIAAEAGVIGLIAYLLLAGSALWYSYAAMRRCRDPLLCAAVLGVVGALVATDFHNLFDVLYVHGMVALLGLLMVFVPLSFGEGIVETPRGTLAAT